MDFAAGSIEDNVLTLLVWNKQHAFNVALKITPDLFSSRAYKKIAREAIGFLHKHSVPVGVHLDTLLEDDLARAEEGQILQRILDRLDGLKDQVNADFVTSQLDEFIEARTMAMAVENAADALAAGRIDQAREFMARAPMPPAASLAGTYLHDLVAVEHAFDVKEEDYFATGVDVLDRLHVAPRRGTAFTFMAPSGRGKTWAAIECARQALMHGHGVLHVSLEMSEQELMLRYFQAYCSLTDRAAQTDVRITKLIRSASTGQFTGINFATLDTARLGMETKSRVLAKMRGLKFRPRLLLKRFPGGSLTVPQLITYLDYLERADRFRPDLLVVDYPRLMKQDPRNIRESLGQTVIDLRGLCVARDIAGFFPAQGNRTSDTARNVTRNMIGEDFSIVQTSDVVVTYSQTKAEHKIGLARLSVEKARSMRDGFSVLITQSYDIGQFCLDSTIMSNDVQEELKAHLGEDADRREGRQDDAE